MSRTIPSRRILAGAMASSMIGISFPLAALATEQSFSDIPPAHPAFSAVEYWKSRGVLQGYGDGTFRPESGVKRAEAVKIIVADLLSAEELRSVQTSVYSDVPTGVWYLPYVSLAHGKLRIIDGPPKTQIFAPERTVKLAEFLKMYLSARDVDAASAYGDLTAPLSADVASADEWFFPLIRYGLATSMISVTSDGQLSPGRELTRGDFAQMLYYAEMYDLNRRTQALLSQTESDLVNVLQLLESGQVEQAWYAASRAIVAARGALAKRPDTPLVKGAVKVAEGFRSLVSAYRAGVEGKYDQAIILCKEAWGTANRAIEFSPTLELLVRQMQTLASGIADEARAQKALAGG